MVHKYKINFSVRTVASTILQHGIYEFLSDLKIEFKSKLAN